VRLTSLLRQLIGLEATIVVGVEFDVVGLVVDVRPSNRISRCSGCGRKVWGTYDRRRRRWRHLDLAGMKLHLRYELRRVACRHCDGVRVEAVPWADPGLWFTRPFEDQVGYLAQRCDKSTVSAQMRIAWTTVGDIIQRVVDRHGRSDPLDQLTHIGVDELSYRRHHEYVTVVVDHARGEVIWAKRGKSAETLKAFFDELGAERCARLEAVTIDMSGAYIKAVTEASPNAQLIFDRFHVQRLAHDAVDQVRRAEVRAAEPADRRDLKGTRWALHKNPWNLTVAEHGKLVQLQQTNRRIYRAYLLKEALLEILDHHGEQQAAGKLVEWIRWARRSRLGPFVRLGGTIKAHLGGILAYVRTRLSNGRVEGLNGKARTITRRSYGLHSADSLIAMLKLCCGGIHLSPVFSYPKRPTKPL
jgi:transposase